MKPDRVPELIRRSVRSSLAPRNHARLCCATTGLLILLPLLCGSTTLANPSTASRAAAAQTDATQTEAESTYQVGVARIDVTPDYPIRLNGFAVRKTESEGISQPIWAKALAINSEADGPAVVVTLDSLGIRLSMVDEVARRVAAKTGLKRERLAVTFTHTHSAPKVNGASDNIFAEAIPPEHQQHIDRYTAELTDALEQVVLAAIADCRPSTLAWAVGRVGFARNRRRAGGPVDHDLPVLVVRDRDGKVRAVYTSYACHCVTLSQNRISGDWAGYAQEGIERLYPGAVGMVSIGCGSDQNPVSGVTGDKTEIAEQQGLQIADEIARLIQSGLRPIRGQLQTVLNRIELPFSELPTREQYAAMAAAGGPAGYNATTQLARLDRGEVLPTTLEYPVQTWRFGDSLCMVFLGGEVCVDYALRLKQELNADRLWLNGYSNDFGSYIPSERLLTEGGYGAGAETPYFALPTSLRAGIEKLIVDEVHRQVPESFQVAAGTNGVPAKSPIEALASLLTHPELQVQLVAAEPMVADPVAIDFGPDGSVWVAEMIDYARGVEEEFSPSGQVRVLTDTNRDGNYDQSTVFLDALRYPTDVKVWRNGALICDAPDIIYAEDTNGDGRADIRRVLFSGFATLNGQARVNSLQWGLDNWLYGSCGLFGGIITNEAGEKVDVTGRDFRLRPDSGEIEPVTGRTQQSRVRDDWDNWFGCDNGTLVRHYPVYDQYSRRNPFIAPPATSVSVPSGPNAGRLYPPGDLVLFRLSGAPGVATAACGVGIYRDNLLGEEFRGNSLTCEPVNQLVYRQVLARSGATFRGRRAPNEQQSEFLVSSDQWFRPVQMRTGPDGAIWIVDMYRYVIEHPRWIPDETLEQLNVFAGQGLGRIYRVVPKSTPLREPLSLQLLNSVELAAALDTPNGTRRDLIQQMLIWKNARDAAPMLRQIAADGGDSAARLSALCTLDGLNCLTTEILLTALKDSEAEVRRHAIRLAEPMFGQSVELSRSVLQMVADPAYEVRHQLACSLGYCSLPEAAPVLVRLAADAPDDYMISAALSSLNPSNLATVVETALSDSAIRSQLADPVLATAAGMGDDNSIRQILKVLLRKTDEWESWQYHLVARLLDGVDRRKPPIGSISDKALQAAAADLAATAVNILKQNSAGDSLALDAMQLIGRPIGYASQSLFEHSLINGSELLADSIAPQFSAARQSAAVRAIVRRGEASGAAALLQSVSSATPVVRREIVNALLSQKSWRPSVLDALESGVIFASDLDAGLRDRLFMDPDPSVRDRAAQLLATSGSTDRRQIVEQWANVAQLSGDATNGKAVFAKRCASCHRLQNMGYEVGPDLAALTTRSSFFLLTAILDPSRDVDGRYQGYIAVTDEGRAHNGLLVSETATSITLREAEGRDHVLLRNRLDELRATGKSAMPEGIERDITKQQLADLITFLQTLGPAPKTFPGNEPQLVQPDDRQRLILNAATAAIYGGEIIFESDSAFQNIGYWHGADDRVSWEIQLPQEFTADVWLDYSCDHATAGNHVKVEGGDSVLAVRLEGTGGWDQYRHLRAGKVRLPAGRNIITLRPAEGFRGQALMDLRAVRLLPAGMDPEFMTVAAVAEDAPDPVQLARWILDETRTLPDREKLIADWPQHSAAIIRAMTADLPDDEVEEYRRIPWIWRVAIAAGKRNQAEELLAVVDAGLPNTDEPLRDWQAVVIGGGIINGISLTGAWPGSRLERLIAGNNALSARWDRSIALASTMTENEKVRTGTRYDAIRMIAMESWEERGAQISKYLAKGINDELQMGAISGMSDMPAAESGRLLLENIGHYSDHNRSLALDAMLRTTPRITRLLNAVEQGSLNPEQLEERRIRILLEHPESEIQSRAAKILNK